MPKKVLSIAECEEILQNAEVGYLAMCSGNEPYCLPFNFFYEPGKIYIHTGLKGLKWNYLAQNSRVCFTVAIPGTKITGESPCQYTYEFESVIVQGRCAEAGTDAESRESLAKLIDKYRSGPVTAVPEEKMAKLKMLRIDVETITGRQNL